MQVAAIFGVLNLLPPKRKSRQVPKPNMLVKGNLGCSYAATMLEGASWNAVGRAGPFTAPADSMTSLKR